MDMKDPPQRYSHLGVRRVHTGRCFISIVCTASARAGQQIFEPLVFLVLFPGDILVLISPLMHLNSL
jgi:hypothetical protein